MKGAGQQGGYTLDLSAVYVTFVEFSYIPPLKLNPTVWGRLSDIVVVLLAGNSGLEKFAKPF